MLEESSIHNIAFSIEKFVSPESGEKYAHIKHRWRVKSVQHISKLIWQWILMWEDNRGLMFLLEEALLRIMDFGQKQQLKRLNDGFVSYKQTAFHFTSC